MAETLYQYLPEELQQAVDQHVKNMAGESWATRFLYLFGLLCERLENRSDPDPTVILRQWPGIVTAYLEKQPPDSDILECLALMSISYDDQWRAQALAKIDRDPSVLERLHAAYPSWFDVVESVVEAGQRFPGH